MRVAYFCADPGVPLSGTKGCSVHTQEVICALRDLGHSVEVFAANRGSSCPSSGFHQLPVASTISRKERETDLYNLNKKIPAILEEAGPFDFVYERHSLWSYAAMEYARSTGIPSVLEVNSPLIEEQQKYRELIHHRRAEHVARRAFQSAEVVLVVSSQITKYVKRFALGKCRVQVVPNGVNPGRFPTSQAPSIPREESILRIGFVGSLKPWHGLSILAEAFSSLRMRYPNLRLLIVGDGPERANFEESLRQMKLLDSSHFTGAVLPENVPGLLSSMDIAVAPYPEDPDHYFSPLKVYEYMAAGLPVVAARIGQIAEVIEDEENGLLFTPGNASELARAIEQLIRNAPLRKRLGTAARIAALRYHTWERRLDRIFDLVNLRLQEHVS